MEQKQPTQKKRTSRWAIASFVLACLGALCGATRPGPIWILGLLLAFSAICLGIVALCSTPRESPMIRGRALAVSAVCLGGVTAVSRATILIGLVLQQLGVGPASRQAWNPDQSAAEVQSNNRMRDEPAASFNSNLPIAILETSGFGISKDRPIVVRARFFDTANGRASLAAKPDYDGLASIHVRGYSTLHLPKSSYTLHTLDAGTNQIKVPLLGLPPEEDWVLYAPYEDKTLMRDVLAYELTRKMGRYAPRTRFLELFIRRSNRPLSMRDYAGVYVLVEKIKRGKERVNIAKLDATDASEPGITGGYILKRDHSDQAESRFRTRRGGPYSYVYPKAGRITPEQARWIRQYLVSFESALYGANFTNPQAGYAAFLDVESFIDSHWLIELSKNVDGFRYSSFLSKDRGGKLKTEPPWDWNRSFGNANYYGGGQPRGWYWPNLRPNEISWYHRLQEDPDFVRRCDARWIELRKEVFDPKRIARRIDEMAALLNEAQQRNFRRWPVLGRQITCNHYVGDSFQDEVNWLKKWVDRRVAWIDSQVRSTPAP